jgi:hypothetical protein
MVLIRLVDDAGRDEEVPGDLGHGLQDERIAHAPGRDLSFDHGFAPGGEGRLALISRRDGPKGHSEAQKYHPQR